MKMGNSSKRKIVLIALFAVAVLSMAFIYVRETAEEKKLERIGAEYEESRFETLRVKIKKRKLKLKCFKTKDGDWYAFLPSFCDGTLSDEVKLVSTLDNDEIKVCCEINRVEDGFIEYKVSFEEKKSGSCVEEGMLKVMHSRNLPSVYIETESGNLDLINENKEYLEKMKTSIYDAAGNIIYKEKKGFVKGHGNRSFNMEKKPYTIKLSQDVALFGMNSSNTWVLVSNVADATGIQNAITYNMARNAGMPYTPKFQYVDLYFNSNYHGTYMVTEKIDINENNMNFNDLGRINLGLNPEISTDIDAKWYEDEMYKGYELDRNPVDITGGYIIERDYGNKYAMEKTGFRTNLLRDCYVVKSPANASIEQVEYVQNLMNGLEESLEKGDGSWTNYIDADSFVDKYIIEEFTQNEGGGATSAYYYKPQDSISKLIFAGPVWDYDTAYFGFGVPNRLSYCEIHPYGPTKLYYILYQDEMFQNLVKERYKSFYSEYIGGKLLEDIEYYDFLCGASFDMNEIRWGYFESFYLNMAEYLKEFIQERKQFLDSVWIEDAEVATVRFVGGSTERNYSVIKGDALYPLYEDEGYTFINCETGELFDNKKPVLNDEEYEFVLEPTDETSK